MGLHIQRTTSVHSPRTLKEAAVAEPTGASVASSVQTSSSVSFQALEAKLASLRQASVTKKPEVPSLLREKTAESSSLQTKDAPASAALGIPKAEPPSGSSASSASVLREVQDFGRLLVEVQTLGKTLGTPESHLSDEAIHHAWYWGESMFADYKV
ncbi:MAG: hypothetical protein ACKO37_05045 [Vampirovibrionales bacterium]